jgi:hypothetical protein
LTGNAYGLTNLSANLKRGFNRLYIVLACMWAVYFLFVYPQQQKAEALRQQNHDATICYASEYALPHGLRDCLTLAEHSFQTRVDMWSPRNFYLRGWWLLSVVVLLLPLIGYGLCRGAAAVSLWVWRGFRVTS